LGGLLSNFCDEFQEATTTERAAEQTSKSFVFEYLTALQNTLFFFGLFVFAI